MNHLIVHDDRLGPYARAELRGRKPRLVIFDADGNEFDESELVAIVSPLPSKIRLSLPRLRKLGMDISKSLIRGADQSWRGRLTLNCRFEKAVEYLQSILRSDLDDHAAFKLAAAMPFSRYIGKLVISDGNGPVFHILVDATETDARTAVVAFVGFRQLRAAVRHQVARSAQLLGVELIYPRVNRAAGPAP